MEENEIMLDVVCYSEKEEISLGFGFCISETDKENKCISDPGEIAIGISESYYELWEEFEPGVEKARKLIREKRFSNVKDALLEVFGHFMLRFSIDGVEEEFDYDFDVDECMIEVIEGNNSFETVL